MAAPLPLSRICVIPLSTLWFKEVHKGTLHSCLLPFCCYPFSFLLPPPFFLAHCSIDNTSNTTSNTKRRDMTRMVLCQACCLFAGISSFIRSNHMTDTTVHRPFRALFFFFFPKILFTYHTPFFLSVFASSFFFLLPYLLFALLATFLFTGQLTNARHKFNSLIQIQHTNDDNTERGAKH